MTFRIQRLRPLPVRTLGVDLAAAACGVALLLRQVLHAATTPGIDFVHVWNATHQLLAGAGAYADPLFTYPPGSALLLAPIGATGYGPAKAVMLAVNIAAVLGAAWLTLTMVQERPTRRTIALALLALGALDAVGSTWANGNVNGPLVLLEVLAIRSMRAGRWQRAGLLIGLSLAVKPVLAPVLVVFALRRQWRAGVTAAVVPVALSVVGFLVVPDAGQFVRVVVPFLLQGAQLPFNDSLVGVGHTLGLGSITVAALRVLVAAAAVGILAYRWRRPPASASSDDLIYVEVGVALAATFLVAPMSETYYTIYLLPSLVWFATTRRGGAAKIAAITATCFSTLRLAGVPGDIVHMTRLSLRPSIGWVACLVCFALPLRARDTGEPAGGGPEAPAYPVPRSSPEPVHAAAARPAGVPQPRLRPVPAIF